MESRPVQSIFTPKEVITDVTNQGVTSVTIRLEIHSIYTAKTVVLTGVHRGPHQAFYTGVKFLVLAQHPVVLF